MAQGDQVQGRSQAYSSDWAEVVTSFFLFLSVGRKWQRVLGQLLLAEKIDQEALGDQVQGTNGTRLLIQ